MQLLDLLLTAGGIVLTIYALIFSFAYPLDPTSLTFRLKVAAIPVGVGLIALRAYLARRYDPNAVELAVRQRIAANRAVPKARYDALLRAAQPPRQKVWPQYESSRVVWERRVGDYRLVLEDDIQPRQGMIYEHLLRVYALPQDELHLCVAASRNEYAGPSKDGPNACMLRLFRGYEVDNLGISPAWADIRQFEQRALEVVGEQLGLPLPEGAS